MHSRPRRLTLRSWRLVRINDAHRPRSPSAGRWASFAPAHLATSSAAPRRLTAGEQMISVFANSPAVNDDGIEPTSRNQFGQQQPARHATDQRLAMIANRMPTTVVTPQASSSPTTSAAATASYRPTGTVASHTSLIGCRPFAQLKHAPAHLRPLSCAGKASHGEQGNEKHYAPKDPTQNGPPPSPPRGNLTTFCKVTSLSYAANAGYEKVAASPRPAVDTGHPPQRMSR